MQIESDQIKTAAAVGVLALVFTFVLWMPTRDQKQALQTRIDTAKKTAQDANKDAKGMIQLVEQVNELEDLLSRDDHYVPGEQEMADLLRQLTSALAKQHTKEPEVKTEPTQREGDYNLMPVKLRFQGKFASVFSFLKRIESMRRLVRVTNVEIDVPVRDDDPEMLDIRIELYTFFKANEGETPS